MEYESVSNDGANDGAYHPLAHRSHQMSATGGPQVNKFEQVPGLVSRMSLAKSDCAGPGGRCTERGAGGCGTGTWVRGAPVWWGPMHPG